MSKPFRITLAIILTLLALVTAALAVMSTPWFRRTLERRLTVALEDMTGGRVEFQEFRFHPLALQAIFKGFVLHGSEAPPAPPLFSARTFVLRLNPTNLLHRQVRIMSLDWDGAELHLRTNPDGSTNLPGPVASLSAGQVMGQLIDLRIGRVTLAHSTFFWDDRAVNVDLSARDVALLVHLRRGRRYEGSFAASAMTARGPAALPLPFTFSARFVLSQNEFNVSSITWQSRGMSGRGSMSFHPAPEPEGYFSFQSNFDAAALNSLLRFPDWQNGSIRLEGQGVYRQGEITAHGRALGRQLSFRNAQFDTGPLEVSGDYSLERSRVHVSSLKVLGWGGSALGEAQLSLAEATPQFQVRARLRDMNLSTLLHASGSQPLFITLLRPAALVGGAVELTWAGKLEKLKSSFDLSFSAPAAPPAGFLPFAGGLRGSLEADHGFSVSVEDLDLHSSHSRLRAKGTLAESAKPGESPASLQIQCETEQFDESRPVIEAVFGYATPLPLSFQSPATFVGEVSGSRREPHLRGALRLGKFTLRGWTWDGFQANIAATADSFQVSSGRLAKGTSLLNLETSAHFEDWRITKTSPVRFSARAQRTPLEGLEAALGIDYPLSGRLSGQVDLNGTPADLAGSGRLKLEDGNLAGETFDSFSTSLRVTESTWDLETLEMLKGHGKITGKAQIKPSTHYLTCLFHGSGLSLAEFKRLNSALPNLSAPHAAGATLVVAPGGQGGRPDALRGQASFDLQGGGTPDYFRFHSIGLLQGISIGGTEVGDLHVRLEGEGRNVQIQGVGSGPAGMFSFSGETTTAGDWPLQLQGQYVSFRLDPWARLFLNNRLEVQVTASGSFEANGSLRDSSQLGVQSQIEILEVSFPSLKWRNERPVQARYASHRLSAQPFRMQGPSTDLTIDGSLDLAGPASLSLTAQGTADATILSLLDPALQASGQSRIKVNMSGPPSSPQLTGAVEIQNVSLESPGFPFRLSNLNGEIQLEGERATVKSLRGVSGGGTVVLNGYTTLALPPRVELRAELAQVRVHYPFDLTSILSGSLRLAGTSDRLQLGGDLAVTQVLASENRYWLDQITQPVPAFQSSAPVAASPLASSVRLNVRVSSPAPVSLRVQDMRLTAGIDVHLQGSLANPVEVGGVHFLNGEAIFRGNRFTLDRGDLNLTNPLRTQGTLDLEAQTRVEQYNVTVDISGPLGQLRMNYRSDPPLPTEDVLSLLTLGYARQQQQSSASAIVSSFGASNPTQTVGENALLTQALSSQVGGRIQRLFGVSRIKIDPNVGMLGFSTGARVTIEQQITKDLTLTYITNTASSQYQIIQFEWAVGENVSLLGVRDPNGIFGVEVRFRRRFK
jgi:translocation and assembly module TamB